MTCPVTVADIELLYRPLSPSEKERAEALLPVVYSTLKSEADRVGKDLELMMIEKDFFADVLKSVMVDIIARVLMTPTNETPMTQMSQSAGGYSVSGTYLVPGGGLFIKKSELARLGLRRQRIRMVDPYGHD